MRVTPLSVAGAALIELEPRSDERGSFARAWDGETFAAHGLETAISQMNLSTNVHAGTLRGLHWQVEPHSEAKLFRCIKGRTFHVTVDMRPTSPTYRQWAGVELDGDTFPMMFMPAGCAAGYQALTDGATVLYTASRRYAPEAERGLRWDDPAIGITWPRPDLVAGLISPKDAAWPLLDQLAPA